MAHYYVDSNGRITKKKKNESKYSVDEFGKITINEEEEEEDIAPLPTHSDSDEKREHLNTQGREDEKKSEAQSGGLLKDIESKRADSLLNTLNGINSSLKDKRLYETEEEEEEDIAPLPVLPEERYAFGLKVPGQNALTDRFASQTQTEIDKFVNGEEKERTWFQKGALENGVTAGNIAKTILGTGKDIGENLLSGALGIVEGVSDAMATVAGGINDLANYRHRDKGWEKVPGYGYRDVNGNMVYMSDLVRESVAKDTINEEYISKSILGAVDPFKIDADANSVLGEKSDSLVQSGGQLIGQIGLQAAGIPWYLTTGATSFGGTSEEAFKHGASYSEAIAASAVSAGAEILTEKLFGGSGLGEKGLINVDVFTKRVSDKALKTALDFGIDVVGEGSEEVVSQIFSNLGSGLYRDEETLKEIMASEEALDGYLEAAIGGMVLGGVMNTKKAVSSVKNKTDYRTGVTAAEQTVIDKEIEKRIAESQKDGNELSRGDKNKIEQEVLEDLENGYISVDTIEEALGGDSYKAYKDALAKEEADQKEYESLLAKKESDYTKADTLRFSELHEGIEDIRKRTKSNELKSKMSEEVFKKSDGNRFLESYNERTRRGQSYTADLSKYNEKQKAIVQKAIDSGILNNTNRTHKFVDIVSKMAADKGVTFDFLNNAKLKESGFAKGNAFVNGYYDSKSKTIGINMDSAKAWQSTVGHEITHVLEGTELYNKLKDVLFKYAESKGEYASRRDALSKLYAEEDIDSELVADLVGDYLFQDADFVNHLSATDRNVFQKIYDEIKYLAKVATAGTKEAREIEKIKHVFEKAYKSQGTAQTGTKHSLSETTDGRIAAVVDSDILSNIDTSTWDNTKKDAAKKAASEALKQFADGIVVDGITRKVNKKSRDEYTRSHYTESLYRTSPDVFADKMRAAEVADDIVVAATNWSRDGGLKHPRSDGFVDFDHGHTLIVSGNTKYSAEVVVGITAEGEAVLYDVVDMTPTTFDIKNAEPSTAATTQNAPGAIHEDSAGNSVPQTEGNVNTQFSLSEDSDGKSLSDGQKEFFKDSKIVDEKGNLRVMYHGTPNGEFTIFRDGTYFTANKEYADKYQNPSASSLNSRKVATSPKTFEVYLNITKPFDINDPEARRIYINDYIKGGNAIGINPYLSDAEYDKINSIDWTEGEDLREFLVDNDYDYDGLVLDEGAVGGYGEDVEYRGTSYVVFSPEQVKSVDNQNPTSDPDIHHSLSEEGEAPVKYGNFATPARDLLLETAQEDIAPVQETTAKVQEIAKTPSENVQETTQDMFPDDYAPMSEDEGATEERLASLNESDVPPEMEAPYYGEDEASAPADPFEDRDIKEVGKRKVKAYMYENPEVKPFFQEEANIMLGELNDTVKGEKIYTETDLGGVWTGTSRYTSDDIAYLRDSLGYTYAEIEKGLNAIIEDDGAENNAISKRIEFILNDRLADGYTDFRTGMGIPANQEYINLLKEKQITDYSREAWDSFVATADQYAPPMEEDIAPVVQRAPVTEEYEAIRPRRQAAEPVPMDDDIAPIGDNVQYGDKLVRTDTERPGEKRRKWVGTSTESKPVKGKVLPDDLNQDTIHYQPISNKTTLGNANARLGGMGYDASLQYFNSQFANKKISLDDIALGERLIQEAVKRGDTKTAGELIQNVAILGTELGQKVQALSIIKRLTPEGQLGMLTKVVERGKTKGDKAYEGVELTQEMKDEILSVYGKDGTYDQKKLNEAVEKVKKKIADQMKVTKMDKVNAWRYLSMLGNPKTHIRNVVSNIAMKGTVAVKNVLARTIETVAPIQNRTKTWRAASDEVKAFAKQTAISMKEELSDGGKYNEDASIKAKRQIFKNKILNGVYEFNSDLLSKEDWWFSKSAFQNSLSEYLTANGIRTEADIQAHPEIVEKAKQYATEQAQIATFQQYSWLANKLSEMERHNTVTQMAVGSVMPFKKTPINIAKTGLNYSPLGFAKTLTYDIAQVKNGKMEASELVDHLSQNITGSALTLVGYLLANAGLLSGGGEDDKEGEYDYQLGEQSYAINIGGKSYSLSWLSPAAMPMFIGANAYEQLVEGKEWNGDVVVETLAQTLDPLSEMSFLSGLNQVLSSYDSGLKKFAGIGESMAQNYVTQFVPTLSSQVATVMDDTKRSTKVAADSDFKFFDETINKLKLKIPGLRETLEPTTDIWGNDIKLTDDTMTKAFETFIAPYSVKENIATEIDAEIKALYRQTGDNGIIPSIPYNYVNYKDEKYEMSAKDYTAFKKTYGQTAYHMMEDLFDTSMYQNASAEEKADMVNKVYDYARDLAKKNLLASRGVTYTNATSDGVEYYKEDPIKGAIEHDMTPDEYNYSTKYPEKYNFLKDNGVSYSDFKDFDEDTKDAYDWAFKNPDKFKMSQAITDDFGEFYQYKKAMGEFDAKDAYGNSVSGLKKERVAAYISGLDLEYGRKLLLFKSQYPSDDSYNREIIEYLDSRSDVSYEDMVTILTSLGFKVNGNTVTWD